MNKDLTTSEVARRNILNNTYALQEAERAIGLRGVMFENQRDEDFVRNLLTSHEYHQEFVDALTNYVDLGKIKYVTYTDKVYKSIFKEMEVKLSKPTMTKVGTVCFTGAVLHGHGRRVYYTRFFGEVAYGASYHLFSEWRLTNFAWD